VEDDCVSPTDAANWIYDRNKSQQSRSDFLANHRDIEEEDENEAAPHRRDSESFEMPDLNPIDRAKLLSCIEEIRNIVGDTISEKQLVETIMGQNFDLESALNAVLNINKTPPTMPKMPNKVVAMEKGEVYF
jgi:elongation factor 1 alpha-like protein